MRHRVHRARATVRAHTTGRARRSSTSSPTTRSTLASISASPRLRRPRTPPPFIEYLYIWYHITSGVPHNRTLQAAPYAYRKYTAAVASCKSARKLHCWCACSPACFARSAGSASTRPGAARALPVRLAPASAVPHKAPHAPCRHRACPPLQYGPDTLNYSGTPGVTGVSYRGVQFDLACSTVPLRWLLLWRVHSSNTGVRGLGRAHG